MPGLQPEQFMATDHERTAEEIVFLEDAGLSERDPDAFAQRVRDVTALLAGLESGVTNEK
jgi:hypothetical protein